ncbi:MAG: hypothetical protein KDE53_30510, partial [Caldilineaceae bacterium]|nr:hypothetical protein [Caldilineaceae bacterium]
LVKIAQENYPAKRSVLETALEQHQAGVGAWEAALANLNRVFAMRFRETAISVIVAIITAWIMAGVDTFILQREFVILLCFFVIIMTPFLLRAGAVRFRLPMRRVGLVVVSALLMMGEAALFSEIVGGTPRAITAGERIDATPFVQRYLYGSAGCLERNSCKNQVKVKGQAQDAQVFVEAREWEAPYIFVQLNVEWGAREEIPGLRRNYEGQMIFASQFKCTMEGAAPNKLKLRELSLDNSALRPSRGVLSWIIGFIQIPYLSDETATMTVRNNVENILLNEVNVCDNIRELPTYDHQTGHLVTPLGL